jgi:hypothetical protein
MNATKKYSSALVMFAAVTISGCASIVDGSTQNISVKPMQGGKIVHDANCIVSNSKGSWHASGGQSVVVKKASDDLNVSCTDYETGEVATQNSPKKTNTGWAVANFFLWDFCTISCIIDFSSGAIYEYPSQVVIPMAAPVIKQAESGSVTAG